MATTVHQQITSSNSNVYHESYLHFKGVGKTLPAHESTWKTLDDVPLTREAFLDVLEGRTPVICERGFINKELAHKYEEELSPKLSPYLHVAGPDLFKVGIAQFEFQAQSAEDFQKRSDEKERYFNEVRKLETLHSDLAAKTGTNVWALIMAKIASLVPEYEVIVANEGPSKKYFSGIFRAINESTPIHCDWSPYDSLTEDWLINKITRQAVFNLYLSPVKGGRTVVHDVQWTEESLDFRDPSSYGYSPEIVQGRNNCTIHPSPGDLCFFNSRNMHQVFPVEVEPHPELGGAVEWRRPRLTLSSFMGLLPPETSGAKPRLIFWS
ncbi:MAG: hypothetical protein M1834_007985 [Cirrosporium novae-zelandiae]|nr:MAG: hypothetical protein M1834_007985 [Cirrosporium novae-zelandiae]